MATEEENRLKEVKRLQEALKDLASQAAETEKQLEAALGRSKDEAKNVEAVTAAIRKQAAAYRAGLQTLEKINASIAESKRLEEELLRLRTTTTTSVDEYNAATEKLNKAIAHTAELESLETAGKVELTKAGSDLATIIENNAKAQEIYAKVLAKVNLGQEVTAEDMAEAAAAMEEYTEKFQAGAAVADTLQDSILGLSGGFSKFAGMLEQGEGGIDGFVSGFKGYDKILNLAAGSLLKLVEVSFDFALEQDKVFSEFRKSTGAGREFDGVMKDIEGSGRIAGVTLEETAQAVGSLKNTFTDFTYFSKETQKEIGKTVTILAEMGLTAETQSQILQTATQSLGMSVEGAQGFLLDLHNTATSLGIDVDRLGQEFEKNRDILARYGGNATKVFKEMAVQAKAAGMEVSQLLGVVDKFKTFDGAAQAVGRLNAIMGKPALNAMDMLNAAYEDPAAGVRMIKDAFDEAGNSVEALSGQELMVWSDALGMSAAEAANFLGQSNEELQINQMEMEEAAQKAQEMQNITEQLSNAFKQLYLDAEPFLTNVLIPMVTGFADFMQIIGSAIRNFKTFGATAIFVGTALAGIAMMIPGLQPLATAGLVTLAAAVGTGAGLVTASAVDTPPEAEGASTEDLSAFAKGGRVFGSMIPRPLKRFSNGGMVMETSAGSPSIPIRMNEANRKELAIVPSGTMIANADDTKNVIQSNEAVISELQGLRRDLANAAQNKGREKVQLVLDNGREFATTVVREGLRGGNAVSPFGGGKY